MTLEDKVVLETTPTDFPLDITSEVHLRWRMQRAIKRFQPISDPRLVALLNGDAIGGGGEGRPPGWCSW